MVVRQLAMAAEAADCAMAKASSPDRAITASAPTTSRQTMAAYFPPAARRLVLYAMATACFWGFPAFISVRMFWDWAALLVDLIRGMRDLPGHRHLAALAG